MGVKPTGRYLIRIPTNKEKERAMNQETPSYVTLTANNFNTEVLENKKLTWFTGLGQLS